MLRVLVVDDHAVVRRGLIEILREAPNVGEVAEAPDGQQALTLVREHPWDAVVLDVSLPGRSGLEVLGDLRRERPALPVLVLSVHSEAQYGARALRAGAAGYMSKERTPEELVDAVRKIVRGGRWVSAALAEKLALELGRDSEGLPHEGLSDRELQVLSLIASGKTVSEVAAELSLSVKTISTYRARILEKTGLASNAALTHYAISHGLVT